VTSSFWIWKGSLSMKQVSILGCTGSIGTQSLDVCEKAGYAVHTLCAHQNITLLEQQALQFRPKLVIVTDEAAGKELQLRLAHTDIPVRVGFDALLEAVQDPTQDVIINALMGVLGLLPTLKALQAGNNVALANKETLVAGGKLVTSLAKEKNITLVPIDSEHSAIFQCLQGNHMKQVEKLIITASGGPFFGKSRDELVDIKKEQALKHPNWSMGAKITIDSSTLANKALEFIEAMWLFGLPTEQIDVVVHRQSIVHSLVEYVDGSVMAQLGAPDMRVPIQYALTWPNRMVSPAQKLDLLSCPPLTFAKPDMETFTCLKDGIAAAKRGGLYPCIFNAANEQAVELFLQDRIAYLDIFKAVHEALSHFSADDYSSVEEVLEQDKLTRQFVRKLFSL